MSGAKGAYPLYRMSPAFRRPALLAAALALAPLSALAGEASQAGFTSGPWGARPQAAACSQAAVLSSLGASRRQIERLSGGKHAEGSVVAGSVFRHNDCDPGSGWCTPLLEAPERFDPNLNPAITDPCVVFCVRVHEWRHFSDGRRWSIRWSAEDLSRYWELPAYQAEAACLETFKARPSLDPKLLKHPRF